MLYTFPISCCIIYNVMHPMNNLLIKLNSTNIKTVLETPSGDFPMTQVLDT